MWPISECDIQRPIKDFTDFTQTSQISKQVQLNLIGQLIFNYF